MRVNYRKDNPDSVDYGDNGEGTVMQKVGNTLGKAVGLAAKVYVGKKVGEGLSDIGEGLKNPQDDQG